MQEVFEKKLKIFLHNKKTIFFIIILNYINIMYFSFAIGDFWENTLQVLFFVLK